MSTQAIMTLDSDLLTLVTGGDGPESADTTWGRRLGGVLGATAAGTAAFAATAPATPVVQAGATIAAGAAGQYAGEAYGARRGASGLALDVATVASPPVAIARGAYNLYCWARGT